MVFIQLFPYIASLFLHSIGDLRQPDCGMGQRGGDRVAVVIPWYVSGFGLAADTSACAYVSAWSYSIVDASLRIIFVSRHHFSDQRQHRCYHSNHRQVAGKAHRRRHLYMTFTELEFAPHAPLELRAGLYVYQSACMYLSACMCIYLHICVSICFILYLQYSVEACM